MKKEKPKDNRLTPSVYGVGFIGVGRFSSKNGSKNSKAYDVWRSMMARCYREESHAVMPTYKDCTVCREWHNYQNFAEWFYKNLPNDGERYHLEKDLKMVGNKEYGPSACIFVKPVVNLFITDCAAARGEYMVGVTVDKLTGKFRSRCRNPMTSRRESLGLFNKEIDAHMAWRKRKYELACELAMLQEDKGVKAALLGWADALSSFKVHVLPDRG